jgi:hypothetical protein
MHAVEPKEGHLDGTPILNEFLEAARVRKAADRK